MKVPQHLIKLLSVEERIKRKRGRTGTVGPFGVVLSVLLARYDVRMNFGWLPRGNESLL